jgi:putative ABC transport system permease protein
MAGFVHDLLQALRDLRRRPAFALAVAITLALALGANAVIFSFVSVLVLRPLPLREPERLGWLYGVDPQTGNDRSSVSLPDYAAWRDGVPAFEALAGRMPRSLTLSGFATRPLHVRANLVVGDLHHVWGIPAILGRPLATADERAGAPHVAVLSHRFWQRELGGRRDVIGRSLRLDGAPYDVVGVLAPEIEIGSFSSVDLWLPLQKDPAAASPDLRDVRLTGRLRPGATVAQANAQAAAVAARLEAVHPQSHHGWRAQVLPTKGALGGPGLWITLALLVTVVGLLMLLACANVTNLLLARLIDRRRDLAVRAALGASRRRIVRELLAEGLVLGALGGALGTALAAAALRFIRAVAFDPFFELLTVDRNVVAFAALLAFAAPLFFVLPAAVRVVGRDPARGLQEGGRGTTSLGLRRGRNLLVGVQVAIALALLSVAMLVVRSVAAEFRVPLGFDPGPVLTLRAELGEWKYAGPPQVAAAQRRLLARLAVVPGVDQVALTTTLPLVDDAPAASVRLADRPSARPEDATWAALSQASEGFFAALRVPVVAGRPFVIADRDAAPRVAVISLTAARRYWGGAGQALGRRLVIESGAGGAPSSLPATVVGVVGDTANSDAVRPPEPQIYLAAAQQPPRGFALVLRGSRSPEALAGAVRRAIAEVDPELAVYQLRSLRAAVAAERQSNRIIISLLGAFAGLALLLATVGLYGVMAYAVAQRQRELAVRTVCGASPRDLRLLVLAQGMRLALLGAAVGLVLGLALSHLISSKLFGVTPTDVPTFAAALATVLWTAAAATLLPALRAERVSPAQALRSD